MSKISHGSRRQPFQAVLHRDASVEMSYKELAAKDAIVGIYPVL